MGMMKSRPSIVESIQGPCRYQRFYQQEVASTMSESKVIANQKTIVQNQITIIGNQAALRANQTTIKKNQATILKNQAAILKNQGALNTIIENQKKILARLNK
jgi:hypothetical protein